jgi:hypothetical protein
MAKFVIKDIESGKYFNSIYAFNKKKEDMFDDISKATIYTEPNEVSLRISKLPQRYYTVEKLIIKL